ncbi:GH20311 [Drosophila grimshawi]|uniref:GH20311 n=1 Tax=Drosophila grimshawi TaxID=7222 RepID=B4J501_DROGR|nr:GH20311 [Drosophila grimshawi]
MYFTVPVPADVHELGFSCRHLSFALHNQHRVRQRPGRTGHTHAEHSAQGPGAVEDRVLPGLPALHGQCQPPIACECQHGSAKELPASTIPGATSSATRSVPKVSSNPNTLTHFVILTYPRFCLLPLQAPDPNQTLMSAATCALGLVFAVGLLASMMYVRARKQLRQDLLHTSFTTAGYGRHQNVFIRFDPLGRPPSATGSYATIASLNKYPVETKKSCSIFDRFRSSPTPTPYATALLPMGDQTGETIYSKPESVCPSRISYYTSSQETQLPGVVLAFVWPQLFTPTISVCLDFNFILIMATVSSHLTEEQKDEEEQQWST